MSLYDNAVFIFVGAVWLLSFASHLLNARRLSLLEKRMDDRDNAKWKE